MSPEAIAREGDGRRSDLGDLAHWPMLREAVGDLLISGAPVALSPIPIGSSGLLEVRRRGQVPFETSWPPLRGGDQRVSALDGPTV